MPIDMFAEKKT